MEFLLYGLAAYSLISKKQVETTIQFSDLLGNIMNFNIENDQDEEDDEDKDEDY